MNARQSVTFPQTRQARAALETAALDLPALETYAGLTVDSPAIAALLRAAKAYKLACTATPLTIAPVCDACTAGDHAACVSR